MGGLAYEDQESTSGRLNRSHSQNLSLGPDMPLPGEIRGEIQDETERLMKNIGESAHAKKNATPRRKRRSVREEKWANSNTRG